MTSTSRIIGRPQLHSGCSQQRPDCKRPPIPQTNKAKLLLASGIQAGEWMDNLRQEYKVCLYLADALIALGGPDTLEDDNEMRKQRSKRAKQWSDPPAFHGQIGSPHLSGSKSSVRHMTPQSRRPLWRSTHHSPVQRGFYQKGLAQDVKKYVQGCAACSRAKQSNEKPFGLLQSLEIPKRRWERINVDFATSCLRQHPNTQRPTHTRGHLISRGNTLTPRWVPSHLGVDGNGVADEWARNTADRKSVV